MANAEHLVSVVTPFHNTRLNLFEKCVESLKSQTIGFENIEWVIVLHNSEDEYVAAAREMVAGLPNVKLSELYNEHRTASSPRNECMKHVTGKYVFFLDADDFLFPYALKTLRDAMEEHGAAIGSFREESIVGSEGLNLIDHLRLKTLLAFDAGLRDGIADVALCAFDAEYDRARGRRSRAGANARPRTANAFALPRPHDVHGARRPRPDQASAHARHRGQAPLLHDFQHV